MFQHTAARRRLANGAGRCNAAALFQHTAARRRLVSAKAARARSRKFQHTAARRRLAVEQPDPVRARGFNTQPPEGGWGLVEGVKKQLGLFQHTAARRRLGPATQADNLRELVSTHSRPKAAGGDAYAARHAEHVSTHSRPKAAGLSGLLCASRWLFQHTAARRRLAAADRLCRLI